MAIKGVNISVVGTYFESLSDPRHPRNCRQLLVDMIVIANCASICNAEDPIVIHRWAKAHAARLATFLPLPNGLPSRDSI